MGFGKDGKGTIIVESQQITIGALGNGDAKKADAALALQEDFRIIKTEYSMMLTGTIADGDHVWVGLADNELSATEIAEVFQVDGPLDRNDRVKDEQSHRPVWLLEHMGEFQSIGEVWRMGEKNFKWTFSDPEGWSWFVYNFQGTTITTGAVVNLIAKHFGVWVT